MNRVVQFDEATMRGLAAQNLERLLVEFDELGHVLREIGIGTDGRIGHRSPGTPTLDKYGIVGTNVIAISGEDPSPGAILMEAADLVPMQTFEELWASD